MTEELSPDSSESEVSSFEDAVERARAETTSDTESSEARPADQTASAEAEKASPEPEHLAWVKKVSGNVDPQTGQLIVDSVAKQAFELNKQNQQVLGQMQQVRQLLLHPEVLPIVQRIAAGGKSETEKPKAEAEKTDQEILQEFVDARVNELTKNLQQRNDRVYQKFLASEFENTYRRIKEEFPNYDEIREEVGALVAASAKDAGLSPDQLMAYLAENGRLYDAIRTGVVNVLFPKLQSQAKTKSEESGKEKLRAKLPSKGTPSSKVRSDKSVATFEDAVRAAKEELGMATT